MSDDLMLAELLTYVRARERVCPLPEPWHQLWSMLPPHETEKPPPPLILEAWSSPPAVKRVRLREHLQYAHRHGALPEVDRFVRSLRESDWQHTCSADALTVRSRTL